jgi:hypothetical protein
MMWLSQLARRAIAGALPSTRVPEMPVTIMFAPAGNLRGNGRSAASFSPTALSTVRVLPM